MTRSLLDTRPVTGLDPVAELHALIDQLHDGPAQVTGHARTVAEVDRAIHRLTAYKLKVLVSADRARVAADAGFADTNAWAARQTRSSRATAARDVALATDLETGHDTTAAALEEGLLSPAHAAVIVQASKQLPDGCSDGQRGEVEASLVEKAQRFDPDQLRRVARRAIEVIEPDQATVDAHENDLVATEEEIARSRFVVEPARQRRRHHHRTLHRPEHRSCVPAHDHRLDDGTTADGGVDQLNQAWGFDKLNRRWCRRGCRCRAVGLEAPAWAGVHRAPGAPRRLGPRPRVGGDVGRPRVRPPGSRTRRSTTGSATCPANIGSYRPELLEEVVRHEFDARCNWKFFVENHVDVYHLWYLHARTLGDYDHDRFEWQQLGRNWVSYEPIRDGVTPRRPGAVRDPIAHIDERDLEPARAPRSRTC